MIYSRNLLYTGGAYLMLPWALLHLIKRGIRYRPYWRRWHERFGFAPRIDADNLIWVHAVSVGEVRTIVRLVKQLQNDYPDGRILVTTMTPTGSSQVRQCLGDAVLHCYIPYDFPGSVRRFLDRVQPKLAFIVETEFWPNIFRICHDRSIPLLLVNVRLSPKSFNGYRRFPRFTRNMLSKVTMMAAQSEEDAARLRELGARNDVICVTGNLKFDAFPPDDVASDAAQLRRHWGESRPVWIAASTHEGEEKIVLDSFRELRQQHPGLLLVLVPRHPERFTRVARLCKRNGLQVSLRSEHPGAIPDTTDVLLGDTIGELHLLYAAADIAFVGGSLVRHGGHNIVEAMAVGVPTVCGPHIFNFEQSSNIALECGAASQVQNAGELATTVGAYLDDPAMLARASRAATKVIEDNHGSLKATQDLIRQTVGDLDLGR
jgi:3-deoxy-D-manno-octulosonic-acid transferase